MKNWLILLILISIVYSCNTSSNHSVEEILQVDREFSASSVKDGWKSAFLKYAHPDVVILRDNSMPIVGDSAFTEQLGDTTDLRYVLSWKPLSGKISNSGDLGFTYGVYHKENTDGTTSEGTYVTIWHKDKNGQWKFTLDSGNFGLGEKN